MKRKCLVEVEFDGPDAEKGPQILVDQSNSMSSAGGIKMPGINCRALSYKLVEQEKGSESSLGFFLLGSALTSVLAWLI